LCPVWKYLFLIFFPRWNSVVALVPRLEMLDLFQSHLDPVWVAIFLRIRQGVLILHSQAAGTRPNAQVRRNAAQTLLDEELLPTRRRRWGMHRCDRRFLA